MEDFPSNSKHVEKADAKPEKLEKITTGDVVQRKKPLGKRVTETFIGGDAKSVGAYVVMDVLIPAAKDTIADAVSQGIERMLFGEGRASTSRRTGNKPKNGYVSYNRYSGVGTAPPRHPAMGRDEPQVSQRGRATHNFDEIILATRPEAEEVIDRLFDLISRYESATVADLYDLVGVTGNYTDDKWGWTNLRGAGVTRVRGNGYLLDLPKPEALT